MHRSVAATKLHRDGHIPFVPDYAYWQRWKEQVQYWTGDGWVTSAEWSGLESDASETK
ncbi:MAG: hypothetical protein GVY18_14530 [Bacteroidetes bacterium]|nr:hypothetical protein [Bacteroidota bacterium]